MGANISSNVSDFNQNLNQDVTSNCNATASCNNTIAKTKLIYKGGRYFCNIGIAQSCIAGATCQQTLGVEQFASALNKFSNKQQASWLPGMNVSINSTNYSQNMNESINQSCKSTATANNIVKDTTVVMDGICVGSSFDVVNTGVATSQCKITIMMDMIAKLSNDVKNEQAGSCLLPCFCGGGGISGWIVMIIVIMLVLGVGGYFMTRGKKVSSKRPQAYPALQGKYPPRGNALPEPEMAHLESQAEGYPQIEYPQVEFLDPDEV